MDIAPETLRTLVRQHHRSAAADAPKPLRTAIWGCGPRARNFYAPIVRGLGDALELVGVASRNLQSARALAEEFEVPAHADLEALARDAKPELLIVCVSYADNGIEALRALDLGIPLLLETPLSHRLKECDAIVQRVAEQGLPVQVAEQNFLFPIEAFKTRLVRAGVFGDILTVQNDYWGFRYHGMSQLRMLAGFDNPVVRVRGLEREHKVWPHPCPWDREQLREDETWTFGTLEFDWGTTGIYHYTSVAHDLPIRSERSLRFYGAGGYGMNERYYRFDVAADAAVEVPVDWQWRDVGGAQVLDALVAHPPGCAEIRWGNPFRDLPFDDDHIGVATALMALVDTIRRDSDDVPYGVHGGRIDQELVAAISISSRHDGTALEFPIDRSLVQDWD